MIKGTHTAAFELGGTLYVLPKDSVPPVEDRAIAFPSVCFCVVFIKIQNTAFWQHCIYGEYAFSKLTKPLHLHMYRVNSSTTGFPSRIVPTKHIVWCRFNFTQWPSQNFIACCLTAF